MTGVYPGYARRNVHVPPMSSAESVLWAIRTGGRPTPDYVKAVFRSYIDIKYARGKTAREIEYKLSLLERELPAYAEEFRIVRMEKGLSSSNVLGPAYTHLRRVQTSTSAAANNQPSPASLYRANTSTSGLTTRPSPGRVSSVNRTQATATPTRRPTTTTRPVAEDDEELPPPPYTRVDPEPDSTRLLQERLAAEAANTVPSGPPPGIATPPNEPVLIRPTTPPPTSSTTASTPARTTARPSSTTSPRPAGRASSTPPRVPSDPELRRIWEESQFDEATRMSTVAERERLELEEAMRLSLAEAEASGSRGGFEDAAGPGDDSPGSRRASSYTPHADAMGERRRNTSDAGQMGDLAGLEAGMGNLDMLGGSDQQQQQSQSQQYLHPHQNHQQPANHPHVSPQPTGPSLLDDDDDDDVPLAASMLTPNKTGAVMQSNNPFLSPSEREQAEAGDHPTPSSAGPSTPQPVSHGQTPQSYPSPHLSPPGGPARDSPAAQRTTQSPTAGESPRASKPLPSPPGPGGIQPARSISYAPPPGPPPAHLRIPSPGDQARGREVSQSAQPQQSQQHVSISGQISPKLSAQTHQSFSATTPTATPTQPPLPPRRDTTQSHTSQYAQGPALMSPTSTQPSAGPPPIPLRPVLENGVDPLETLRDYDTVFLIDDSASMAGQRWNQAMNAIIGVAEIAAGYDEDGIDVYFLNSKRVGKELKTRLDVEDLFAGLTPRGSAPTGARMEVILRDYMGRLERSHRGSPGREEPPMSGDEIKPMNLIVVTGGAPFDDLASVVVTTAKRLDRGDYPLSQVGIQFFQVGDDTEAREALQELDDGLSEVHGVRDIVDTVPYVGQVDAPFIIKTLLGGVNRRQDRRAAQ